MPQFRLTYREVIPDQSFVDLGKEITLSLGGTQSTLQDIKVAEKSDGYCYVNCLNHLTRNRFIFWRINYDVLELVEHSLDINLTENRIRYRFIDTPILDGISISETEENVVILVPTVCSVHRLSFPHPYRYFRHDELLGDHPDPTAPSIFAHVSSADAHNPSTFHVFTSSNTISNQLPVLAASYFTLDAEAIFVLSYPSGELLLIKQSSTGDTITNELKTESIVPRFLSGLAEKFRPKNIDSDLVLDLIVLLLDNEPYVLTLCRDGQLKFWSCNKGQCVAVNSISETGDLVGNYQILNGQIKKVVDNDGNEPTIVVALTFDAYVEFFAFKPLISGPQIRFKRICKLLSPENDLIHFAVEQSRLWSAWRKENGELALYTARLDQSNCWMPITLESLPETEVSVSEDCDKDPKQIYLEHIFYPGRFPMHIISKALCIFQRSTLLTPAVLSPSLLKQRICMAIDTEIQNTLNEAVVSDEEYLDVANSCWQKFYSCVVQYHIAGLKPIGLLPLSSVQGAVFLKKSSFSFLRPMDTLEYMSLVSEFMFKDHFLDYPILSEDLQTTGDVLNLFELMYLLIEHEINPAFRRDFQSEMALLKAPDIVMEQLLKKVHSNVVEEFAGEVSSLANSCDIYKAIHKILELLRFDSTLPDTENDLNPSALHFFSSQLGVSFVAGCFRQQSDIRFSICRNLLLVCNLLLRDRNLDWKLLEAIRSVCMPEIVVLTQASYVLLWLSGLPATVTIPHDSTFQRLQSLKLAPVFNLRTNNLFPTSLLELFTLSSGGYEARRTFVRTRHSDDLPYWHVSLISYLHHLRHFICSISNNTVLPEWLLSSGQHLCLQQYVQLLSTWCEWNTCTRDFLLATSFLTSGENYKALDLYISAAKGIVSEPFLEQRIATLIHDCPNNFVAYYLKVIQLFELHKARDCAIKIANLALSVVEKHDPLAATLYSIKFKHQLALKHYEAAFESLISNPDIDRRKDNLRDLVKTLLDEKKLDVLLNFTYGDMEEFFCNILLSRARAADPQNIYYDFLYAYQIKRGPLCYRLAASVMYEQAFRLSNATDPEGVEKQVKSLLAAKNMLHLCDEKYAWVVRPADPEDEGQTVELEPLAGSEMDLQIIQLRKQVEVINIDNLKDDLIFSSAKLKLTKFDPKCSANVNTPIELVTLLNNAGLFKTALEVCTVYKLPYNNVFENLTRHCIMLMENELPNAWEWLVENDLQDLPVNRDDVAEIVWKLLRDYLSKYEEENMSVLHQVVCKKIISMGIFIPHWLIASFKERNPSELLNLLHASGRLQEAADLANDYLLAAMGYGKEYFGFKVALTPNAPAFCLPVYRIQHLIDELEIQNERNPEKPYLKQHANLSELFRKYLETSIRISNEMCMKAIRSK